MRYLVLFYLGLLILKVPLNTEPIFNKTETCLNYYHFDQSELKSEDFAPSLVTHEIEPSLKRDGDVVYLINGRVDYLFFKELVSQKTKKLILSSSGGLVRFEERIINYINKNKIEVIIPPGGRCYSACATIFLNSEKRYMGANSTIMLHTPRSERCIVENLILKFKERDPIVQTKLFMQARQETFESFKKNYDRFVKRYGKALGIHWLSQMGKDSRAPRNGNLIGLGNWYIDDLKAKELGLVPSIVGMSHRVLANINLSYFRKRKAEQYVRKRL